MSAVSQLVKRIILTKGARKGISFIALYDLSNLLKKKANLWLEMSLIYIIAWR